MRASHRIYCSFCKCRSGIVGVKPIWISRPLFAPLRPRPGRCHPPRKPRLGMLVCTLGLLGSSGSSRDISCMKREIRDVLPRRFRHYHGAVSAMAAIHSQKTASARLEGCMSCDMKPAALLDAACEIHADEQQRSLSSIGECRA